MDMSMDLTEINTLANDLARTHETAPAAVRPIVARGAHNVRRDAQQFSSGLAHAPHYPRSITWDLDLTPGAIAAEIGPDKDLPQGALGNLLEYGSRNNAPIAHLGPALDLEGPRFEDALADAVMKLL